MRGEALSTAVLKRLTEAGVTYSKCGNVAYWHKMKQLKEGIKEVKEKEPVADMFEVPKTTQPVSVSIIIAARDEAVFLGSLIPEIRKNLSGFTHEIIVVDDGSQDGTDVIARTCGAMALSRERSGGKGSAMRIGVQNASGDILIFLDGDGAHDPKDIPNLIIPILEEKADLVIGSRVSEKLKTTRGTLARRLSNYLASIFISVVISFILPVVTLSRYPIRWRRIKDCTSGLRAIKKQSWQKLDIVSQGFQIEMEMIYEAVRHNLTIAETPIRCNGNNNGSHLSVFSDGLRSLKLLAVKLVGDMKGKTR